MILKNLLFSSGLGLAAALAAIPAWGAEQMTVTYGAFEVSIPVEELESYARTGEMSGEMARYAKLFSPDQEARLRQLLDQKLDLSPTLVSQVVYSKTGDILLDELGALIEGDRTQLRETLVRAAASPQGLTVANVVRQYPAETLRVDAALGIQLMAQTTALVERSDRLVSAVEAQAQAEAQSEAQTPASVAKQLAMDLRSPGSHRWTRHRFSLRDDRTLGSFRRQRVIPLDLYLPEAPALAQTSAPTLAPTSAQADPLPVAVISHGLASNRRSLAYLAEHLASHGIAVAVPEHVGSSGSKFQQFFGGLAQPPEAREALDRPLDIQFALDHLSQLNQTDSRFRGRLNLEQVTAIGQSFGGYTALALGGATLNFEALQQDCDGGAPKSLLPKPLLPKSRPDAAQFNFSQLLQCRINELSSQPDALGISLSDPRIKAVVAINPMTRSLFGRTGMAQVRVPTLLVASSDDPVVPPAPEQLEPFGWLGTGDRYLAVMRNATHFSAVTPPTAEEQAWPLGGLEDPNLKLTQGYMAALSLAFVQRHGAGDETFAPYLTATQAQQLSQPAVPLSLVQTFSAE